MTRWRVSNTEAASYGPSRHHGFSFRVETVPNGAPLLTLSFDTEAEATEAETAMRKIIENAADVVGP